MTKTQTIEVDEATAATLRSRAAERGVSVSELVAELVVLDDRPITAAEDDVAELDHRWKKVAAGHATAANQDVVRWLRTWGTPTFRPWREQ